jgi:hypothetical protein
MLKQYKVISGIHGVLEGLEVLWVEPEYEEVMIDLAEVNAVYPDTYFSVISNIQELNKRRDDNWRKENPDPGPCMHEPSMMGVPMPSKVSCTTVQIGTKLFHFDMDSKERHFYN